MGTVDYEEFITLMCPSAATIVHKFRSQYKNIDDVRAAFKRFDANGDGALSRNELAAALKSSGHPYSDVEVDAIFSLGDTDGDGEVSLQEFVDLMSPSSSEVLAKLRLNFKSIADVKTTFKKIDSNNDGLLSKQEMLNSPGCKFDAEEVDAIFNLGDINGDGELDMGEFIGLMFPPATEVLNKLSANYKNIEDIKAAFKLLDVDGDGSISRQEMSSSGHKFSQEQVEALFALGDISRQEVMQGASAAGLRLSSEEVDTLFILGDKDGNGQIDFSEFAQIMIPSAPEKIAKLRKCFRNRSEVEAAFRRWDANGDGSISLGELKAGLSSSGIIFSDQEVETCFAVGDRNGDNEVSMEEFVDLLSSSKSSSNGPIKKFLEFCVERAFNNIDTNKDGAISYQELSNSLRKAGFSDQDIHTIFALADHDGDGEVSLHELIRSLSKSA